MEASAPEQINARLIAAFSELYRLRLVKNQADFANKLGYNRSYINSLMTGKKTVTTLFAERLFSVCGVNVDWLLLGYGNIGDLKISPFNVYHSGTLAQDISLGHTYGVKRGPSAREQTNNGTQLKRSSFSTGIVNDYRKLDSGEYLLLMPLIPGRLQAKYSTAYGKENTETEFFQSLPTHGIVMDSIHDNEYVAFETPIQFTDKDENSLYREVTVGWTVDRGSWQSPFALQLVNKDYLIVFAAGITIARMLEITDSKIRYKWANPYGEEYKIEETDLHEVVQILHTTSTTRYK